MITIIPKAQQIPVLNRIYLAIILACFSLTGSAHQQDTDQSINKQINVAIADSTAKKTVEFFHQALRKGNAILARKLLDDNVLIYEGGGAETSADEYANHHMKSDITFLSKMKISQLEEHIQQNSELAIYSGRSQITGQYHGKDINMTSAETIVLRKINGQWRIINIHWSN